MIGWCAVVSSAYDPSNQSYSILPAADCPGTCTACHVVTGGEQRRHGGGTIALSKCIRIRVISPSGTAWGKTLDVFRLRDKVIEDYSEYIRSFLANRDERIKGHIESELDAGALWPEPSPAGSPDE
jgi:hypothetical protein